MNDQQTKFSLDYEIYGRQVKLNFNFPNDEAGILNRVTVVLFAHGWDILEAYSRPNEEGLINDIFIIENILDSPFSEKLYQEIQNEILYLLDNDLNCIDYLQERFSTLKVFSNSTYEVESIQEIYSDLCEIKIRAVDSPGVLMKMTYQLDTIGLDIVSFSAKSEENIAYDTFQVRLKTGGPINKLERNFLQQLLNKNIS